MNRPNELRLPNDECRLVVIQDQHQQCPYIPQATARMPLRLPVGSVTPEVMDRMLSMGFRRSGSFAYKTECPGCDECKPTRVIVADFHWTKSFKRVLRRGDRDLECRFDHPCVDAQRVEMFNEHRRLRHLGFSDEPIEEDSYRAFLWESFCDTRELSIYLDGRLVAVSIFDVGRQSASAVYTHFCCEASWYSLGTYAVLKQMRWAAENGRRYLYLGMYVTENRHLNYKARYLPQQRLIDDKWVDFS
ncbi:arginyl-tRNA-protein transferase [Planctomycetes bacterium CA13]|uniref:Arginyl-tRNA-protein transferase n=1 Tax=Novipirellula herctigrandis TaxID=2527986 RepID=A0A5C5YP39_9BACT|nr:arginyl-tRNA-protein transferase [Planctomycetes bacterium CA13]